MVAVMAGRRGAGTRSAPAARHGQAEDCQAVPAHVDRNADRDRDLVTAADGVVPRCGLVRATMTAGDGGTAPAAGRGRSEPGRAVTADVHRSADRHRDLIPPSTELFPAVVSFEPPWPPMAAAPPRQPPKASPSRASALPQTSSGIDTGTLIWLPPRMLLLPLVVLPPVPARATAEPDAVRATVRAATLAVRLSELEVIISVLFSRGL